MKGGTCVGACEKEPLVACTRKLKHEAGVTGGGEGVSARDFTSSAVLLVRATIDTVRCCCICRRRQALISIAGANLSASRAARWCLTPPWTMRPLQPRPLHHRSGHCNGRHARHLHLRHVCRQNLNLLRCLRQFVPELLVLLSGTQRTQRTR